MAVYGGNNLGNYGATLSGGSAKVNISADGYVVFNKVFKKEWRAGALGIRLLVGSRR